MKYTRMFLLPFTQTRTSFQNVLDRMRRAVGIFYFAVQLRAEWYLRNNHTSNMRLQTAKEKLRIFH